ncbi:MAG: hypothetical protein QOD17_11185, partial [Nitrososphaeraceae archaeon]|nr:hypothetical protein [Nitrososphaeraceae archaeon]
MRNRFVSKRGFNYYLIKLKALISEFFPCAVLFVGSYHNELNFLTILTIPGFWAVIKQPYLVR